VEEEVKQEDQEAGHSNARYSPQQGQPQCLAEWRLAFCIDGEVRAMAEWLEAQGVTHVAMESTGVFWKPLYNILESRRYGIIFTK